MHSPVFQKLKTNGDALISLYEANYPQQSIKLKYSGRSYSLLFENTIRIKQPEKLIKSPLYNYLIIKLCSSQFQK
jgi:hypothetical protein